MTEIMVASFALPDRTIYVSERAGVSAIAWAGGEVIPVVPGLVVDDDLRLTVDENRVETMRLKMVGDPLGLRAGASSGAMPEAMRVEVALWELGTDWDQRETLIQDARASRLSQSLGDGGAITLDVVRDLLSESAQAGEDDTIRDCYRGRLPLLVGADAEYYDQGRHDRMFPIALGVCRGVPLIRWQRGIDADLVLICGHPIPTDPIGVQNNGQSLTSTGRYDEAPVNGIVRNADNSKRRTASWIEGTAGTGTGTGPSWEHEDGTASHYTEALTTDLVHGGAKNARGEVIMGAGMVLEHCLRESRLPVDWQRIAHTIGQLHSWDIGVYIDGRASWMAIIRDRLMPVLPLREQQSDAGIWFSYHEPGRQTPKGTATEGVDMHLTGAIEWDMEITNTVTMRYAYRYGLGDYSKTLTVGPDQSPLCLASASAQTFGPRPLPQPLGTTILHTDSAAIRAGLLLAEANALPRRTFSGILSNAWEGIRPGDTVLVDSASLGGTGILCQVLETPRRKWPGEVVFQTVPRTRQATPVRS